MNATLVIALVTACAVNIACLLGHLSPAHQGSDHAVVASEWTRAESRGPTTGATKQSGREELIWIASSLRASQ